MRYLICLGCLLVLRATWAALPSDLPPPPTLPPAIVDNAEEPEIRIIEKADSIHTEYRLHGRLYMVKVQPKIGPAYYLVDEEGKGVFIPRNEAAGPKITVPEWVLFEW